MACQCWHSEIPISRPRRDFARCDAQANRCRTQSGGAGLIVRSSAAGRIPVSQSARESDARALLTPRELDVLAAIADGDTNKAIARRLGISLHTVKFHVESLFRKWAPTRIKRTVGLNDLSDTMTL